MQVCQKKFFSAEGYVNHLKKKHKLHHAGVPEEILLS